MAQRTLFTPSDHQTQPSESPSFLTAVAEAERMLEWSFLLRVEAAEGFPMLISGTRISACFPKLRPNASFTLAFDAASRGLVTSALQSVAARDARVRLVCAQRAPNSRVHWRELTLERLALGPGAPGRILGRLEGSDEPDGPGWPLEAVAAMRLSTGGPPETTAARARLRLVTKRNGGFA